MSKERYERRDFGVDQFVVRDTEGGQVITGMALPFDRDSQDLGGFVERIDSRAVQRTLEDSDVVMLWQHDSTDPITRESTGLKLEAREAGVFFEANASDFTERQLDLLRRGVVKQMSFGFITISDDWEKNSEPVVRTLLDIDLREISPVTWPAYNQTSVAVRSAENAGINLTIDDVDSNEDAADFGHKLRKEKLKLLTVEDL